MRASLTVAEKIALAETASDVALDSLDRFCTERGLPLSEVTAWSTAYETGGRLGVQALVERWNPRPAQAREWQDAIKGALKLFRPRAFRVSVDANWFTVEESKRLTGAQVVHTPVFQLRAVRAGGQVHWFLYWRRADGAWWPYAGRPSFERVDLAAAEVQADRHRCFRLHPLN